MTREEAINNLNMISVAFVEPVTKEQRKIINDTFEKAIKALKQDLQKVYNEGFEDCRRAALNKLNKEGERLGTDYYEWIDAVKDIEALSELPSIGRYDPYTDKFIKE